MEQGSLHKAITTNVCNGMLSEGTQSVQCPTCQGLLPVNAGKKVQAPVCEKCNNEGHWVVLYRQTNGKK